MDKGLGELGFWLAIAIVFAAMIIAGALKKPDPNQEAWKERSAMGGSKMTTGQTVTLLACVATVTFSFIGGMFAFGILSGHGRILPPWCLTADAAARASANCPLPLSPFVVIGAPLGIWAGGLIIAALIWHFARDRNGPPSA